MFVGCEERACVMTPSALTSRTNERQEWIATKDTCHLLRIRLFSNYLCRLFLFWGGRKWGSFELNAGVSGVHPTHIFVFVRVCWLTFDACLWFVSPNNHIPNTFALLISINLRRTSPSNSIIGVALEAIWASRSLCAWHLPPLAVTSRPISLRLRMLRGV